VRKQVLQDLDKELKEAGLRDPSVPPPEPAKRRGRPAKANGDADFSEERFAEKIVAAIAKNPGNVMDFKQLGVSIAMGIVEGMKQGAVDPEKERIKQQRRREMRETQEEARQAMIDRWLGCSHMRTHPYSGTARIGWATQSDGVTRGTCMGCGCLFTPIESELPDPKRMKGLYEKYRALPVSIAHNDFLSGMVVAGQPA
jgi:hypothetical protein